MLRKYLLVAMCVILPFTVPVTAESQYPYGYIGLFIDDHHGYWCVDGVGMYSFEMWVWCLPGDKGQMCAEFAIDYPPNIIPSTITQNDEIISVLLGDLPSGISVCYNECQWGWHWNFHQTVFVTDPVKTICEIVPHPDVGIYQFANCLEGYPTEPCKRLTALYVNYTYYDPECGPYCTPPELISIEIISPYALRATTDSPHEAVYGFHFDVFNVNDPADALAVEKAHAHEDYRTFTIFLEDTIPRDSTYVLRGSLCCIYNCGYSALEFTYLGGLPEEPDLHVVDMSCIDKMTEPCLEYDVSVTVQNRGLAPSDSTDLLISYEHYSEVIPLFSTGIPPLDIDETYTTTEHVYHPSFPTDRLYITVEVDTEDDIVELIEMNNRSQKWVWNHCPRITYIADRPDDAGGFIYLRFSAAPDDRANNPYLQYYEVLRRIEPPEHSPGDAPYWEVIESVEAQAWNSYGLYVTTLMDSTAENGIYWSVYKVRAVTAHSTDPIYYYSCPDSGYSVDNRTVAALLQSFSTDRDEAGVTVTWRLIDADEDIEFIIHRRVEGRSGFERIDSPAIHRTKATYTFLDSHIEDGEEYSYRIYYTTGSNRILLFETEPVLIPTRPLALRQNRPNPFNPATTIRFYLPDATDVSLDIFDVGGRHIATIFRGYSDKGIHDLVWEGYDRDGNEAASGIYFYRLRAGKKILTKKMVLLR